MTCKRIKKEYFKLISSRTKLNFAPHKIENGLIYTLYSDRFNLIKIGFAENKKVLETKLIHEEFILLGYKAGKKTNLNLLTKILNELDVKYSSNLLDTLNLKYSNTLIRHLSILGWPIGYSIHKQRKIKKELSCA